MNANCNATFPTGAFNSAAVVAAGYKIALGILVGNPPGAIGQAVGMTQSGFDGGSPGDGLDCKPDSTKAPSVNPFWKWLPFHSYE
jgi:hypothetical protein